MATKFLTNLDLIQNQILNGRFEVLGSDPSSGNFEGRMIYNSTEDTIKVYSGSVWRKMLHSVTSGGTYASYLSVSESNGAITLTISGTSDATATSIVARDSNSQIKVAATPTDNAHAASKGYVDSAISGATVSTEQVQDIVGAQIATNGSHTGIIATYDDAGDGAIDLALNSTYSPTFAGLTINGASITFEGATANDFETTVTVTDPTADNTITIPNASGTVALNGSIALGTDTTGNYVSDVTAGTGVTVTHTPGEGSSPTIAIGQAVATSDSPAFAGLTINGASIVLEGATANDHETTLTVADPSADRTITLPDVTGTVITTGNLSEITSLGVLTTGIVFEGATANDYETTLTVTDPTADNTITLPNNSGTLITTGNLHNITEFGVLTSAIVMEGSTANDFELTISAGDPTADHTVTFPDATGTVITTGNLSEITSLGVLTTGIVFEGATANDYETTFTVTDPTEDRTITLPNTTGTVITTGNLSDITSVGTLSSLIISGDLTVNGTTTNINSTNLVVEDKNIVLGDVTTPTDTTADGGGITLQGASNKTFVWVDSTDAWTSSEHLNLLTGKSYYINGVSVLSSSALGSGVTSSSLTSVGTITTGVWNGTDIAVADGGTGASDAAGAKTNLGFMTRYATSVGDGSNTSYTVTHNLGTRDVIVQIREVAAPYAVVIADIAASTTSAVTVEFATAPTTDQYRVVVIG